MGKATEGPGCAKVARILLKGAKVARSSRSHGQKSRAGVLAAVPQCVCRAPDEPPAATDARTEACAAAEAGPVISGLTGKFRVGRTARCWPAGRALAYPNDSRSARGAAPVYTPAA